jgi:hypothetical protein
MRGSFFVLPSFRGRSRLDKRARPGSSWRANNGVVLVAVLLLTLLMSALAAALVLIASSETAIASNFRNSQEARYAAAAAAERAVVELTAIADWNQLLDGSARSTVVDGMPSGIRTLADGSTIDLGELLNVANCQQTSICGSAEMDAVTAERPWGANNPRWRLFAYGWLRDMLSPGTIDSAYYLVVLIGDDPSETDGDPSRDGVSPSPGAGVVELRAQAFGPRGSRRTINLSAGRTSRDGSRVMSWREIR